MAESRALLAPVDEFATSMLEHGAARNAVFRSLRARADFVAGNNDAGFDNLELALDYIGTAVWSVRGLAEDPAFHDVQQHPRFKAVAARQAAKVAEAHARLPATFEQYGLHWPPAS